MIHMYYHAGAKDHGCEAQARTTAALMNSAIWLHTFDIAADMQYEPYRQAAVKADTPVAVDLNQRGQRSIYGRLFGGGQGYTACAHRTFFNRISPGDICLCAGGDYYGSKSTSKLAEYNRLIHKRGAKTVLLPCSVSRGTLNSEVLADLRRYDLVLVRESMTWELLHHAGIRHLKRVPDPSFALESSEELLPDWFMPGGMIGLNISPSILRAGPKMMENYKALLAYILTRTEASVLLIPHSVRPEEDDREALKPLYRMFVSTGRVFMLHDAGCRRLKQYISQCRLFIGAQCHAGIAALSSGVPCLMVGSFPQSRGIAVDIFGSWKHFVLPVQEMTDSGALTKAFMWLAASEAETAGILMRRMPLYIQGVAALRTAVEECAGGGFVPQEKFIVNSVC